MSLCCFDKSFHIAIDNKASDRKSEQIECILLYIHPKRCSISTFHLASNGGELLRCSGRIGTSYKTPKQKKREAFGIIAQLGDNVLAVKSVDSCIYPWLEMLFKV